MSAQKDAFRFVRSLPGPSAKPVADVIALIAVALTARIVVLHSLARLPWFDYPNVDSAVYADLGRTFARGDFLIGSAPLRMSPAYPFFLGAVYRAFGDGVWPIRVVQAALGLVLVVLAWDAARTLAGRWPGLIAGAIVALFGPSLFYEAQLLGDAPAAAIAALALWMMVRGMKRSEARAGWWVLTGLATGVVALFRPNAILLSIPLVAAVLIVPDGSRKRRIASALAGFVLMLAALPVLNFLATGRPTLLAAHGGINLYVGNGPDATGAFRVPADVPKATGPIEQFAAFHSVAEKAAGHTFEAEAADWYWARRTFEYIADHPARWITLMLWKLRLFWNGSAVSDIEDYQFSRTLASGLALPFIQWWFLMPLAMVGTILGWQDRGPTRVVALFNLALCASVVLVFVADRYRLVSLSGLAVAATLPLSHARARWAVASHARRAAFVGVLVVSLFVAWPVAIVDTRADLWFRLATDYERAGRFEEARAAYERVVVLSPGDTRARIRLQRLH
jgi:4-amino-4-deoxy-L-arabinose transferase-like glycosyltransferase